jgi:hypothetical protein
MIENFYVAEYLMKRREEQLNHAVHSDWKTDVTTTTTTPGRFRLPLFSFLPKKQTVCCSAAVCC